jgi:hypothetical protein
MKRLIMLVLSLTTVALSGCVVVPAHGYYYYHPRAAVFAPAPVVVAPAPVIAIRP